MSRTVSGSSAHSSEFHEEMEAPDLEELEEEAAAGSSAEAEAVNPSESGPYDPKKEPDLSLEDFRNTLLAMPGQFERIRVADNNTLFFYQQSFIQIRLVLETASLLCVNLRMKLGRKNLHTAPQWFHENIRRVQEAAFETLERLLQSRDIAQFCAEVTLHELTHIFHHLNEITPINGSYLPVLRRFRRLGQMVPNLDIYGELRSFIRWPEEPEFHTCPHAAEVEEGKYPDSPTYFTITFTEATPSGTPEEISFSSLSSGTTSSSSSCPVISDAAAAFAAFSASAAAADAAAAAADAAAAAAAAAAADGAAADGAAAPDAAAAPQVAPENISDDSDPDPPFVPRPIKRYIIREYCSKCPK